MKRYLILGMFFIAACAGLTSHLPNGGGVEVTIEAQSFPINVGADLQPVAGASSYKLVLNGAVISSIAGSTCSPTKCTAVFPIGASGHYTLAYESTTLILDVDPNSGVDSLPGPAIGFNVTQPTGSPASAPTNVHK